MRTETVVIIGILPVFCWVGSVCNSRTETLNPFSKEKLIAMIATIDEEISNQLVKKKFSNRLNL